MTSSPLSGRSRIFLGAPTSKVGMLTYYFAIFLPKTCMEIKNLDRRGVPGTSLESATAIKLLLVPLESAYSLVWSAHRIWGQGDGETLALL